MMLHDMPPTAVKPDSKPSRPPLWLQLTALALAVLGLAVAAYQTYAHFTGSGLAGCPAGGHGTFDCAAVLTSPQSMLLGVPVAVLGLVFFALAGALMTPWAWRAQHHVVHWLRLTAMTGGMAFVLYLIYAELYQIKSVCEYCTGVHVITFLLFCITFMSAAIWGSARAPK